MPKYSCKGISQLERENIKKKVNAVNKTTSGVMIRWADRLPQPEKDPKVKEATILYYGAIAGYLATEHADDTLTYAYLRGRNCDTHSLRPLDSPDTPTKEDQNTPN